MGLAEVDLEEGAEQFEESICAGAIDVDRMRLLGRIQFSPGRQQWSQGSASEAVESSKLETRHSAAVRVQRQDRLWVPSPGTVTVRFPARRSRNAHQLRREELALNTVKRLSAHKATTAAVDSSGRSRQFHWRRCLDADVMIVVDRLVLRQFVIRRHPHNVCWKPDHRLGTFYRSLRSILNAVMCYRVLMGEGK